MAVKVLVNAIGQHIVSEVKQVENKETGELIAYWLENPRMVNYVARTAEEGGGVTVNFANICPLSDENNFSVRADHIVSILEPREDVVTGYNGVVNPEQPEVSVNVDGTEDGPVDSAVEDGANPGLTD